MKSRYYILALILLSLFSLAVLGVRAAQAEEEPAPGVARVSLIHGDVSSMRGDSGDWGATTVNAPVVRGDKVSTGDRSRAEIQLDYANILRLAHQTEVKVADLSRTHIQVQVAQGRVNYTVLKGNEADIEIDTPNVAVRPLREGSYRIEVNSPSETVVTVRKGEAEIATSQGRAKVEKNEVITIRGVDEPQYQVAKAPHRDEWDEWNKDRDHEIGDARSWRYANHYYTGAHDLDRYGRWAYVPDYGWSWSPSVDPYWAPYRHGRWVWEPYWGWTWVSYEPWGWAPYHYGRWFSHANSWYWWPGYHHYGFYPTWAPAYVSFIGFGFGGHRWHFGFGFGFGSIGWLPLGPYDHYYPWHGYHNTYNVVNITNITNVTNIQNFANGGGARGNLHVRRVGQQVAGSNLQAALSNVHVRRAITTVGAEDFVAGRIPRTFRAVDATTLRQGQVVQGTVPAVPTRESLRPVNRPANTAAIPARANRAENFFTRRQPPAGPRPFTERASEIQQMMQNHNPLEAANRAGGPGQGNTNPARGLGATNPALPTAGQFNRSGSGSAGQPGTGNVRPNAPNGFRRELPEAGGSTPSAAAGALNAEGRAPQARATRSEPAAPAEMRGTATPWRQFDQPTAGGFPRTSPSPTPSTQPGRTAPGTIAGMPQRNENQSGQPARGSERAWQRFGTGNSRPTAPSQPVGVPSREARSGSASRPAATPESETSPAGRGTERPGWQRFGSGAARPDTPAPIRIEGGSVGGSGLTRREAGRPQSQPAPEPGVNRSNWQRFSGRTTPAESAPGLGRGATGPASRQAFQSRPAPADSSSSYSSPRMESSQPGWNRFPSRPEGSSGTRGGFERSAPSRSYERPPLEIRKPIVRERAAPPPRMQGSGDRSWSTPSGGSRGWSAPSGGNRGWSAPSGGSRGWSAPSGGSRGWSAPSGGSRGSSAPSGGGHSAPRGSHSAPSSSPRGFQRGPR